MVEIRLTRGYVAIVDDQDADLDKYKWYVHIFANGKYIYAERMDGGKTIRMHRVILARKLGHSIPKGIDTDHIDRDTLNNSRANLRLATKSQNQGNSRDRQRTYNFRGVYRHGNGWQAQLGDLGKRKTIGTYPTEEEAARAYNEAAKVKYGPFARLNKVR